MGSGVSGGLHLLSAGAGSDGAGFTGQHPMAKGFFFQKKWDKERNAVYTLGVSCAGEVFPSWKS